MKGKAKPYTLVNLGEGLFESRGQTSNFQSPSKDEIAAALEKAGLPAGFAYVEPVSILAGGKWRAVASERLQVDLDSEEPFDSDWAATRVDFYARGGGPLEYTLTLIYTIWASGDSEAMGNAMNYATTLSTDDRLNPGGQ